MTHTVATPIPFVPRTKLRPPRLPDDLLRRPRLIDKLQRPQTLSLVIAPAGYGKTALVSTWLEQCGFPYAWLSLEPDDNTAAAFLTGFVTALERLAPTLADELLQLLQEPKEEMTLLPVLPILLNTLNEFEDRFVIMLDDFHHVRNPAIHQLICGLLEHPPRALQLVLTARYDPPLPPRLRYRGDATEIRARELGFTEQEAQAFLGQFVVEPLAAQAVAGLVKQSEGWAVALRLAAALIHRRQDAAVLDKALQICERSLLDYLDSEVIGHLPNDVQTFLARTSILNVLNASLCDVVLRETPPASNGSIDCKAALRILADSGVFVEQLDETGEWFRYQELFQYLLQRRLRSTHSVEEIDRFMQRARVWQEQQAQNEAYVKSAAVEAEALFTVFPAARHKWDGLWAVSPAAAEPRAGQRTKSQPTAGEEASARLTYREMDVLTLLCERLTNKEIAHQLGISTETVRQHSVNVYRKLGVANRRQAVVQARALGLPVPSAASVTVGPRVGGSVCPSSAGADR